MPRVGLAHLNDVHVHLNHKNDSSPPKKWTIYNNVHKGEIKDKLLKKKPTHGLFESAIKEGPCRG